MTEPLLDGPALAQALGIKPRTIRDWARRGHLTRRGRDSHGRTLYSIDQALHVHETRKPGRPPNA